MPGGSFAIPRSYYCRTFCVTLRCPPGTDHPFDDLTLEEVRFHPVKGYSIDDPRLSRPYHGSPQYFRDRHERKHLRQYRSTRLLEAHAREWKGR